MRLQFRHQIESHRVETVKIAVVHSAAGLNVPRIRIWRTSPVFCHPYFLCHLTIRKVISQGNDPAASTQNHFSRYLCANRRTKTRHVVGLRSETALNT